MHKTLTTSLIKNLTPDWKKLLLVKNDLSIILEETLEKVIEQKVRCCPTNPMDILNFLNVNFQDVKVVIVGQDPYPQPNVANGIAFSCIKKIQPSLAVLIKELEESYPVGDIKTKINNFDITLNHWLQQGVLLMNAALTCEEYKPGSHTQLWRKFTTTFLKTLAQEKFDFDPNTKPIVFVFLGNMAKSFLPALEKECQIRVLHKVLEFPHPAAEVYSGKFIGCGLFPQINDSLVSYGHEPINWFEKTTQ